MRHSRKSREFWVEKPPNWLKIIIIFGEYGKKITNIFPIFQKKLEK